MFLLFTSDNLESLKIPSLVIPAIVNVFDFLRVFAFKSEAQAGLTDVYASNTVYYDSISTNLNALCKI